jgi:hypothetical protein
MGRYFTEGQLDEFMAAYVAKYPAAVERWYYMMDHQSENPGEITATNTRQIIDVAKTMPFFIEHAAHLQKEMLKLAEGEFRVGQSIKFRNQQWTVTEEHLKYQDHLMARSIDQLVYLQSGHDLYQYIGARMRNAYAKK